jgi:hypothetical protein
VSKDGSTSVRTTPITTKTTRISATSCWYTVRPARHLCTRDAPRFIATTVDYRSDVVMFKLPIRLAGDSKAFCEGLMDYKLYCLIPKPFNTMPKDSLWLY